MRQLGNLNLIVIFSILFLINDSFCLYCWRCSSDASNSNFCGAVLVPSQVTDQQKRWSYVNCKDKPPQTAENITNIENLIPKCQIVLQQVNGKETYTRSCHWEPVNVPSDSCKKDSKDLSYVKIIECRTCIGDGCNDNFNVQAEKIDNLMDNTNNNATQTKNSAVLAVVSHTVLFVVLMFGMVIVY